MLKGGLKKWASNISVSILMKYIQLLRMQLQNACTTVPIHCVEYYRQGLGETIELKMIFRRIGGGGVGVGGRGRIKLARPRKQYEHHLLGYCI